MEKLKKQLQQEGYLVMLSKDGVLIAGQEDGYSDILKCKMMKNTFGVEIRNSLIIIDYAIGQIPVEKEFKTIKDLLTFVRQVFPI
ncbi:MAG: hypothetical protein LBE92_04810 [Chryseobacterium sp.]|jgi:hypothetical protein|uniref:hypothetical protein n=1 Tax=Chryseobacterium sp. TaxID=1871047 RepID=UPI0028219651|nr:hypothetical protein [Chryseobacterium sp.]MDR2235421.1 hypothetical protein [Chryseobacterium sp.]